MFTRFFVLFSFLLLIPFQSVGWLSTKVPLSPLRPLDSGITKVVLGGESVPSGDRIAEFTVVVKTEKGSCTGVLVDEDIVLTAGHCFKGHGESVQVFFGPGGVDSFEHKVNVEKYLILGRGDAFEVSAGDIATDYLKYDQDMQTSFSEGLKRRSELLNFYNKLGLSKRSFLDFALLKIDEKLPDHYRPIEVASRERVRSWAKYLSKALIAGFGINSRVMEGDDYIGQLKVKEVSLIGVVSRDVVFGFQVYSETDIESFCLGDSGGPLFMQDEATGEYYLLGMNILTFNACANSTFSSYINGFGSLFHRATKALRSESL